MCPLGRSEGGMVLVCSPEARCGMSEGGRRGPCPRSDRCCTSHGAITLPKRLGGLRFEETPRQSQNFGARLTKRLLAHQ